MRKPSPPVFIVGPGRSGTSILYRSLQAHPAFRPENAEGGSSLAESKAFLRCPFSSDLAADHAVREFMLFDDDAYSSFLRSVPLWRELHAMSLRLRTPTLVERSDLLRIARFRLFGSRRVLASYFEHARRARGCQRLIEKTPAHVRHLPELRATFPHAPLLIVLRHPIDIFASYRRRLAREREAGATSLRWLKLGAAKFARNFARDGRRILRTIRKDDHAKLVRYEQFTADTAAVLKQIMAFLGELYNEACLLSDRSDHVTWKADPRLFGPIATPETDWEAHITHEEALEVETALGRLLPELGYAPRTAPGGIL